MINPIADITKFLGSAGNKVLAGSSVECYCDGTNWHVTGTVAGDNTDISTCAFSS